MASLRSRYKNRIELEPSAPSGGSPRPSEELPPTAAPTNLKLTPEAPQQSAPEPVVESSDPVQDAARSAMQQRLKELQQAETVQQTVARNPQLASEPKQDDPLNALLANSGLPERAQDWLRSHPEFVTDARKNSALQHYHWTCADECEPYSDEYYNKMESLLGLRPPAQPAMRTAEPVAPRRQATGGPVSAPPTREPPSWSSGRRASETRTKLTAEQVDMAHACGITVEEYARQVERMNREKAAGLHQDGR